MQAFLFSSAFSSTSYTVVARRVPNTLPGPPAATRRPMSGMLSRSNEGSKYAAWHTGGPCEGVQGRCLGAGSSYEVFLFTHSALRPCSPVQSSPVKSSMQLFYNLQHCSSTSSIFLSLLIKQGMHIKNHPKLQAYASSPSRPCLKVQIKHELTPYCKP